MSCSVDNEPIKLYLTDVIIFGSTIIRNSIAIVLQLKLYRRKTYFPIEVQTSQLSTASVRPFTIVDNNLIIDNNRLRMQNASTMS